MSEREELEAVKVLASELFIDQYSAHKGWKTAKDMAENFDTDAFVERIATALPNDEPSVDVNRLIEIEQAARDVLCEWDDVNIGGVEMDVADHTKRIERLREALAAPDGREHIEVTAPYRRSNTGEE